MTLQDKIRWIYLWDVQTSISEDVSTQHSAVGRTSQGFPTIQCYKSYTAAVYSCQPRAGIKVKGKAPRWPRKQGRRLLLRLPAPIPDRSWVLVARWCVEWGKRVLMPSAHLFLLPRAKSRTPKLRVIPLNRGSNFCILSESQFHNLERKVISTEQWSNTCVYIICGQNTFFEYGSTASAFLLLT